MFRLANILLFSLLLLNSVEGTLAECKSDLIQWGQAIFSSNHTKYSEMVLYSGRGLNDLGLYFPCQELSDAKYVIFEIIDTPAVVLALCLPSTCSIDDYWSIINGGSSDTASFTSLLQQYSAPYFSLFPQTASSRRLAASSIPIDKISFPVDHVVGAKDMTASAGVMLTVCVILLALGLIGTMVELSYMSARSDSVPTLDSSGDSSGNTSMNSSLSGDPEKINLASFVGAPTPMKPRKLPGYVKFFMCFSLYSNTLKLFATKDDKKKDALDCLNAVRVLSIGWVCIGHTELFRADSSVVLNIADVQNYFKHFSFTLINSAPYAVDSFFWLSGFLQGYLMTLQINSHKKVNWPMILVHRFIRILPLYMFVVLGSWSLAKYMGNGPKWYNAEYMMHKDCSEYFWAMPLFINNFILPSGPNNCLIGAWYLPNDMQFFIVSLPIMYLYVRHSRVFGWGLLSVLITFSIIANGSITYDEHLHARLDNPENSDHYMDDLYYKPYCRISPDCIGLLGGFVYYAFKKGKSGEVFDPLASAIANGVNNSRVVRFLWYGLGLFLINFFIFVQYDAYKSDDHWSRSQNSAYFAFQRFAWGLGMNLFFLPLLMGHMSWFRPFLQSNWWMPLAKLVFGVYLTHMVIGQIYFMSQPVSFYWTQSALFVDAAFILVVTFLIVIPITLFVESPTINLEKILLGR